VPIETAKSIIPHDRSLHILQRVNRGRTNLGSRLPSWVPDWTSKGTTRGIDHGYDWELTRPFCAGKDTTALAEFHDHTAVDGEFYEFLKARAVLVGVIRDIQQEASLEHISLLILEGGESVFGPKAARHEDEVWVLYGASRPVAMRAEGEDCFGHLGDAIVFGKDSETYSYLYVSASHCSPVTGPQSKIPMYGVTLR
jgi:hypothetical protein